MKKFVFWKNNSNLFLGIPILLVLFLAFIIAGIVLTPKNSIFLPMIIMSAICFLFLVYFLFFDKRTLSKIELSEEGIEWKWLGKNILFLGWHEIINIKSTTRGKGAEDLSIISNSEQIDISLTKKIYRTIMQVCPNQLVKKMINDIECFKFFH